MNCYKTKNGNYLVELPIQPDKPNLPRYAYFAGDGRFIRPTGDGDWGYARSWNTPMEYKPFTVPDMFQHIQWLVVGDAAWVCWNNPFQYETDMWSKVTPKQLGLINEAAAKGVLKYDKKYNSFWVTGQPAGDYHELLEGIVHF